MDPFAIPLGRKINPSEKNLQTLTTIERNTHKNKTSLSHLPKNVSNFVWNIIGSLSSTDKTIQFSISDYPIPVVKKGLEVYHLFYPALGPVYHQLISGYHSITTTTPLTQKLCYLK